MPCPYENRTRAPREKFVSDSLCRTSLCRGMGIAVVVGQEVCVGGRGSAIVVSWYIALAVVFDLAIRRHYNRGSGHSHAYYHCTIVVQLYPKGS